MTVTIRQDLIDASNRAREAFMRAIDPVGAAAPQLGGPPRLGGAAPKLLSPVYYGPSFFPQIAEVLLRVEAPLQTKTTSENLDYAGWFNYCLGEAAKAKEVREDAGQRAIAAGRILCVLFDLNELLERSGKNLVKRATFTFPAASSTEFNRMLALEPGAVPYSVLLALLDIGFESIPPVSAKSACAKTDEGHRKFGAYFALQAAMNTQPIDRELSKEYLLFYRGDGRTPETVIAHGGAKCRADLAHWRKASNVDAAWHPWREADGKSAKMWIRRGNNDNDYFTVNSIAMDFHIACAYPMLRMGEVNTSLKGHITDWSHEERARLRATKKADFCLMKNRHSNKEEFVLCDTIRVYICLFKDDAMLSPTYTNNTYPELGVRTVELQQIIAWFQLERFHNNEGLRSNGGERSKAYYESPGDGATMTIKVGKWDWMHSVEGGKAALGLADPSVLENRLNSLQGKVFEISHSQMLALADKTFDVSSKKAAANVWGTVNPAKLKV